MSGITIQATSDLAGLEAKYADPRLRMAQNAFGRRVLADADYFAMEDTGALRRSGFIATSGEEIAWSVPYASEAYNWPGEPRKVKNQNAHTKWFEHAKSVRLDEWTKFVGSLLS